MAREAGRKPGEARAARVRHLAQQALRDSLARMRREGEAWVTFRGQRLRIVPFDPATGRPSTECLVHHEGRVSGALVSDEQYRVGLPPHSWHARFDDGRSAIIKEHDVLAVIVAQHPRGPAGRPPGNGGT